MNKRKMKYKAIDQVTKNGFTYNVDADNIIISIKAPIPLKGASEIINNIGKNIHDIGKSEETKKMEIELNKNLIKEIGF